MGALALRLEDLTVVGDEPVIKDTILAERLGFSRNRDVRFMIRNNFPELESHGMVSRTTSAKPPRGSKGGRPEEAYFLNEPQALVICMLSRTERAAEVRGQIIKVFMAWRRGQLAPVAVPANDRFAPMVPRARALRDLTPFSDDMREPGYARMLSQLLWMDQHKRYPRWWHDQEVADLVVAYHRRATLDDLVDMIEDLMGSDRAPSRSSVQRIWKRLDALLATRERR